jgi:8-oxo-dGTP pyrophosphatase MutT (NUDIX family)/predicted transcriptional regulator
MSNDLHFIQMSILKKLLFAESLKFSELRPDNNVENNLLTFHLDRLIKDGLVQKTEDGYKLTPTGKEFANRMDTDNNKVQRQGKISALQCCYRNINGELEFLVYTRLKHPFYGCQGYPSGKVQYGEQVIAASKRELLEETGLIGDPEIFMIDHYIVYKDNELVEDKYFYFCRYLNPTGELTQSEEGKFEWVKESELDKVWTKPAEPIERMRYINERIKDTKSPLTFSESIHHTDNF